MGNKRLSLGSVITNYKGYIVRQILDKQKHNGMFGVYAGKNKKSEFKTVEGALSYIKTLTNE